MLVLTKRTLGGGAGARCRTGPGATRPPPSPLLVTPCRLSRRARVPSPGPIPVPCSRSPRLAVTTRRARCASWTPSASDKAPGQLPSNDMAGDAGQVVSKVICVGRELRKARGGVELVCGRAARDSGHTRACISYEIDQLQYLKFQILNPVDLSDRCSRSPKVGFSLQRWRLSDNCV